MENFSIENTLKTQLTKKIWSYMESTILSVDCGTQSLRVILFDAQGKTIAKEKMIYEQPYSSPHAGWAEQDVSVYWQAMKSGITRIKKKHPQVFASLKGMGVTTQRDTLVLIDEQGKALRPAILWLDTRAAHAHYRPKFFMRFLLKSLKLYDKILKVQADGKINWLRENEKPLWKKAHKVLLLSGYFHHRLTGNAVDTAASMVGHIPFKNKKRNWASRFSLESFLLPIEDEKKCSIVESSTPIGHVTQACAKETGLPQGLQVIACGSDKACETIGMGVVDTSMASFSFGTTATVEVCTPKYFEPVFLMPAYCSVLPKSWLAEIEIFRGYWMISWFRDRLAHKEREQALANGMLPENVLDDMLDHSPAGGRGLMLQPYWGASLKDIFAKGSIIGFGEVHGKPDIYRAIIEGLAYSLREGLELMEKKGKFKCEKIAVSGGASQSDRICQITSDILNRPLVRGETTETSALGAAILTAAGIGLYPDTEQAAKAMVRYEKTFFPNKENRKVYDGLYNVYKHIYPALQQMYKEIQKVTGYPEIKLNE